MEIATDIDNEGMQIANGPNLVYNGTIINNYILSLLNQIEGIYINTFNIRFLVTYQNLWWAPDPYDSNLISTTPTLNGFASYWQSNFPNVKRDIAYLFSGRSNYTNARGEAKAIGAVCSNAANSYAMSSISSTIVPQVGITVAHEIGHLFGATHPNSTNPASCSPIITLMCIVSNAQSRASQFSTYNQTEINNYLANNNVCLTDVASIDDVTGPDILCANGTGSFCVPVSTSIGVGCRTDVAWSATTGLTMNPTTGTATAQSGFDGLVTVKY